MDAYRKFDPGAFLAEIEECGSGAAKVAKVAKVEGAAGQTLATLAVLAGGDPEFANFGQRAAATYPSAFEERAAIVEFDSRGPRAEAEARAFVCCVVEWLNRRPVRSAPGRCLGCAGGDRAHDPLLPFGTEAVAALKAMGIVPPSKFPDDFGKNGGV